jgi:hypothetical protein
MSCRISRLCFIPPACRSSRTPWVEASSSAQQPLSAISISPSGVAIPIRRSRSPALRDWRPTSGWRIYAHAQSDPMKKFDTPVYPQPKVPTAPLTWPSWLVRVDGAALSVEKSPVRLSSSFVSAPTRDAIQYFYANLLNSHGYRVTQGLAAAPDKFGCWVQGSADTDNQPGRRVVIWIKIKPVGENFAVELSLQN